MIKASYVPDANIDKLKTTATSVPPVRSKEINDPDVTPSATEAFPVERADSGWKGFVNYFLDGLSG